MTFLENVGMTGVVIFKVGPQFIHNFTVNGWLPYIPLGNRSFTFCMYAGNIPSDDSGGTHTFILRSTILHGTLTSFIDNNLFDFNSIFDSCSSKLDSWSWQTHSCIVQDVFIKVVISIEGHQIVQYLNMKSDMGGKQKAWRAFLEWGVNVFL